MKLFFVKSIEPFISKLPAAAEVGAGMRYTLRDAKIGNSLYTTGINTCSGFGLRAGEQNPPRAYKAGGFQSSKLCRSF